MAFRVAGVVAQESSTITIYADVPTYLYGVERRLNGYQCCVSSTICRFSSWANSHRPRQHPLASPNWISHTVPRKDSCLEICLEVRPSSVTTLSQIITCVGQTHHVKVLPGGDNQSLQRISLTIRFDGRSVLSSVNGASHLGAL